ncbi:aspartyl aminopeptidase [Alkalispirochaeta americana]|uniref:M18 family aminopeptidase n=1 Tax=Alkalispirochaeta americana TaxID=159291 RepID=A0A1N6PBZ3_9SPIO|nr:M18 family aminopeptidase [Alkalispirochaeta americana]SIQ01881.1 aspartyl aminopeptidase [Alkalispirochaeta americana]
MTAQTDLFAQELCRFIDRGATSLHNACSLADHLEHAGFTPLDDTPLKPGDTRYLRREGALLACRVGTAPLHQGGVVIAAAHTDSPGLHLKHRSARRADGFLQVPVEVYGAPILATWLDRDLALAGRIGHDPVDGKARGGLSLISPSTITAVIPNLAIHLNREINDGAVYNRQDHLKALFLDAASDQEPEEALLALALAGTGIDPGVVRDAELTLVPAEPSRVTAQGLLLAPRIDNLAGCFSLLQALLRVQAAAQTQMAIFYDHEEIGSVTATGAAGAMTEHFLRRLCRLAPGGEISLEDLLARTVLISNDAAHARHPNYRDKHDDGYAPVLAGGPVVKKSAIRRYASELPVTSWIAGVARRAGVPVQYLQNRSDIAAGSTIGPAVASRLAIPGVDLGVPILGMHSIRETGTVGDIEQMTALIAGTYKEDLDEIFDSPSPR